jgi:acetyl-CoA C-acetyltransferase
MLKKEITVEDVMNARMISWPFTLYDCAAQSDGAAATIITRKSLAKTFRTDPVYVKGVSIALSANPQSDPSFDFLAWKPTLAAARDVYKQAGITTPMKEIHLAQVHDCFTMTELLTYEDLGFIAKGSASEHLSGELPVNTDGGLKTFGHPTGATGVRMIYENVLQLQGRAGERQVAGATMALSHNLGGAPQTCGLAILGIE